MKLYFSPGACSLADHIALLESGLDFETERVDLKTKKTQSGGDYNAVNPKGYVPALGLEPEGVLTENIAILSYIAEKAGTLMPTDGLGRFRALEALAYISTELHKNFAPFFKSGADDAQKEEGKKTLTRRFALLEEQLEGRDFLLGNELSVADCYLFVMLFWAKEKIGLDLPLRLSALFERMKKRGAVSQALADEGLA
ncbi:glutathione binding-like protein [Novosphingobium sp. JCM 18896]|uniref:glutathione binding-like protein n=1 Tax=Novosphingobium sp. JCM 18896 TaxID=2989731 RepID=UPI002222B304|nr:glutathione binding-like protein [Novosphingobium sp. JCM 18896]MCW1430272.1 glutathione binding-like protein [Novosphingobium sp. JCM 18896]